MRVVRPLVAVLFVCGCFQTLPGSGGGRTKPPSERAVNPADVALHPGYRIEPVAVGFNFPTGVTWDDGGRLYVVEAGYSYGEVFATPRILRVEPNGAKVVIARGDKNGPWNGVVFHRGLFYIAEGGARDGGRLLRITRDGRTDVLAENLPTGGDHHANGPIIGPDGNVYFSTGTMTNSAIVGEDNYQFGWLKRHADWHDVPCRDVTLTGENFESNDKLSGHGKAVTGAFLPYGTRSERGQIIKGRVPCSGAVMRISPEGGNPELVGWGFRNPFGLAFDTDGKLLVADNGYDARGSRPVWAAADWLWTVDVASAPVWHGWPEFADGRALTEGRFEAAGYPKPRRLIDPYPNDPPKPAALFACHSSSVGLDVSRSPYFGFVGQAFVAQFGDQAPVTGKVFGPVGFKVVRVDAATGVIEEFAVNKGESNGPASFLKNGGLERPVAVRFSPDGSELYVVDFGVMTMAKDGARPQENTGVLWKIAREGR